jgi:hypothetical protein
VTLWAEAGSTIRYTLDGTDPTVGSAAYSTPIELPTSGAVVKARAFPGLDRERGAGGDLRC